MNIVITGADGFIGKNLRVRLTELGHADVFAITRSMPLEAVQSALKRADFVFHLAGVNRPQNPIEFDAGNAGFTQTVCTALASTGRRVPVVLSSSTQAELDNPYGRSKLAAEQAVHSYGATIRAPVHVFRLTNVFGKWARPNYNSGVATFCYNLTRGLPVTVNDHAAPLRLVFVEDVVETFVNLLATPADPTAADGFGEVGPVYTTTVGEVVQALQSFADIRRTLIAPNVGSGLVRALYSTYISYLPPEKFAYEVPRYGDARGEYVEILKTSNCGQFSYFTAHPGATRGEHYHQSKTEKFLVIKGTARFGFRHIITGETYELVTRGGDARIVDTAPGWAHNITNIGNDELVVMLWANEIFDRQRPDTVAMKVKP